MLSFINEHDAFNSKKTGICKNVLGGKNLNWFANDAKISYNKKESYFKRSDQKMWQKLAQQTKLQLVLFANT